MATAAQLAQLVEAAQGLLSTATEFDTTDDLQSELDGVNARIDAMRSQVDIVTGIIGSTDYTDAEKLVLISQTLGPQE